MPAPYAQNHNSYLKSYETTGVAKILGKPLREMVAMHKTRYVFPVNLSVTKVTQVGGDGAPILIYGSVVESCRSLCGRLRS